MKISNKSFLNFIVVIVFIFVIACTPQTATITKYQCQNGHVVDSLDLCSKQIETKTIIPDEGNIKTATQPTNAKEEAKEDVAIKETISSSDSNVQNLQQSVTTPKSLVEILPKREDIPTEFRMGTPYNMTLRATPEGFDSAVRIDATKIVGSAGLIELDFNIIRFDSEENARKYYVDDTNRIKNEGGYTEIDIEVPSKAECFSFTEDYGYDARFAISDCLKGNLAYQVVVTAAYTFEKPQKYIKDMITLLDNRINR